MKSPIMRRDKQMNFQLFDGKNITEKRITVAVFFHMKITLSTLDMAYYAYGIIGIYEFLICILMTQLTQVL